MPAGDPILAADYAAIRLGTIDKPMVRLVQTVTSAMVSGGSALTFTAESWDPYGYHSTSSNTSRITPTKAGYHHFKGGVMFAATATVCSAYLKLNGTGVPSGQREGAIAAAIGRLLLVEADIYCNGSTDFVELFGDPSASISTSISSQFTSFFECSFSGRATNP